MPGLGRLVAVPLVGWGAGSTVEEPVTETGVVAENVDGDGLADQTVLASSTPSGRSSSARMLTLTRPMAVNPFVGHACS